MSPREGNHPCGVLVVDDDAEMANTLGELLQSEGYSVQVAVSAAEARAIADQDPGLAVALVDLIMPETDGLTLTEQLRSSHPDMAVVIMTGYGTIENAVEAIKRGADDYLTKPFDQQVVLKKVTKLMEVLELRERVAQLETDLEKNASFDAILHVSPSMRKVVERARRVAATEVSVLLWGESGTGKEMLARAIHMASPRTRRPFVPVNCGAIPAELVESELFGHRRGAFTGAHADKKGIFAAAEGGTVFLDELGEMSKETQVKFLRVLQEAEVRPVGSTTDQRVDVRVISASNRPIEDLKKEALRDDFYYRVATVVIEIPPLRSRPEDIMLLTQSCLTRLSRRYDRQITVTRPATDLLLDYPFPGNVRELENILESAAAVSLEVHQKITEKDLKPLLVKTEHDNNGGSISDHSLSLEKLEQVAIQRALRICDGNRTKAAALLGISRDTLYRKLKQGANNS